MVELTEELNVPSGSVLQLAGRTIELGDGEEAVNPLPVVLSRLTVTVEPFWKMRPALFAGSEWLRAVT
jgi:hypothetical protein